MWEEGLMLRVNSREASAQILAFPGQPTKKNTREVHRFTPRDRITAHDRASAISAAGYARIAFEPPEPDGCGEFLLVYGRDSKWASWGIGCGQDGLTLWKTACGTTVGIYETLAEALDNLTAQPQASRALSGFIAG